MSVGGSAHPNLGSHDVLKMQAFSSDKSWRTTIGDTNCIKVVKYGAENSLFM